MGDRISFSFRNGESESITYFSHWEGRDLLKKVEDYWIDLQFKLIERQEGSYINSPIDRLEPGTVILDYIRWRHSQTSLIESNYYLGRNSSDGDNSDNGHWVFDLDKGKWEY